MSAVDRDQLRALVRGKIRDIPDFPKPGILFRDITPVLADAEAFAAAVELHVDHVRDLADSLDAIVGMEARGFLFGPILAQRFGVAFVPARKPGKLPAETIKQDYGLEYGTNTLELHADALKPGSKVLIVDDLLATGGTAAATAKLIERLGAEVVAQLFMIELIGLDGRKALGSTRVEALLEL